MGRNGWWAFLVVCPTAIPVLERTVKLLRVTLVYE